MGGASVNHAPAVTPIITADSNPMSDRGCHFPSPPLQAQATITREDHLGLWADQATTMLHQSSLKTRTFCQTMQPTVSWPSTPPSLPSSNHRHRNVISPYPKDSNLLSGNAIHPVPNQVKGLTLSPPPPPPPSFPITSTVECTSHP